MRKPSILAVGLIGSALLLSACDLGGAVKDNTNISMSSTADSTNTTSSSKTTADGVKFNDPYDSYNLYSDPSITKKPDPNQVFGNGQTISVEYDGSLTKEGDSLFYNLYYIAKNGNVIQITSSVFEGKTKGTFTTSNKVFNSDADGRPGFIELTIVQDVKMGEDGITGKNVNIGMYPIKQYETDKS